MSKTHGKRNFELSNRKRRALRVDRHRAGGGDPIARVPASKRGAFRTLLDRMESHYGSLCKVSQVSGIALPTLLKLRDGKDLHVRTGESLLNAYREMHAP